MDDAKPWILGFIAFALITYWWGAGISLPVLERGHGSDQHPMTVEVTFVPVRRNAMPQFRAVVSGAHHRATHFESRSCSPTWSRRLGSGRDCRWTGAYALDISVLPEETRLAVTIREYGIIWEDTGTVLVPIDSQLFRGGHMNDVGFAGTVTTRARLPPP